MRKLFKILKKVKEKTSKPVTYWDWLVASIAGLFISGIYLLCSKISFERCMRRINEEIEEDVSSEEEAKE